MVLSKPLPFSASCMLQGSMMGYCEMPADSSSGAQVVCAACDSFNPTTTCTSPYQCVKGKCVPPACMNGKLDPGESDIDCGGTECLPCDTSKNCNSYKDCYSHVCKTTCQAPTCTDGRQNGDETDLDCGGLTCPACTNNLGCALPRDCVSGVCKPSAPGALLICQSPTCTDGVKNGDETGVDCGSPDGGMGCSPCGMGQ
jgi:hypothetical protein